jgi:hypothetical protein
MTLDDLREICGLARLAFGTDQLIISGGAPRDIAFGGHIKDIDVFLTRDKNLPDFAQWFEQGLAVLAGMLTDGEVVAPDEDSRREGNFILAVGNISWTDGPPVNVIALDCDPVDDVHRYDFFASQIVVTPNGVMYTLHALNDFREKTITYNIDRFEQDSPAGRLRSKRRLARLRARYPQLAFQNCGLLDDLEETEEDPSSALSQ